MSDVSEHWLPVVGYEGLYEVSDLGRVRSLDRVVRYGNVRYPKAGRILTPAVTAPGRRMVGLARDGKVANRRIYVLVLEAFVGPRPQGADACHDDGDPSNDRLNNLRWDTASANRRDTIRHGRHNHAMTTRCPRGHELFPPNLHASEQRKGKRSCLACSRAGSNYRSATKRGLPADFKQMADDHYRRIMGEQTWP